MLVNRYLSKFVRDGKVRLKTRFFSTSKLPVDNIRNIAILAHIDAGMFVLVYILFIFVPRISPNVFVCL